MCCSLTLMIIIALALKSISYRKPIDDVTYKARRVFTMELLDCHNEHRFNNSVPLIALSDRMSARAQRKAEYLLNKNAPELHPYNQTFVYTIHKAPAVSLTINPRQIARIVCNQWYCEKKNYHRTDFDNERERLDRSARYTQMIWRRSYMAGFGYATIANDDRIDAIVVGFFDEPGNVHGSFDENVQSIDQTLHL